MKIISWELTMPNVGSWNGKWTGESKKYYVIEKISERYLKSKEWFNDLLENGSDNWHHSWNDGWAANVRAEIINADEAKKRRKITAGFCGYDWMIKNIKYYGSTKESKEFA